MHIIVSATILFEHFVAVFNYDVLILQLPNVCEERDGGCRHWDMASSSPSTEK